MVAAINIFGAFVPSLSLFRLIYQHLLKPAGFVKPQVVADNQEPHRFAQGFSGVVTALSAYLVWAGFPLAWAFSWLVIVLANLNVFLGFCATCTTQVRIFEQLAVPLQSLIEPIDVEQEEAVVKHYNILTLPTTILIDRHGLVQHINYGLANLGKLSQQLEALLSN